ncbi:unnamed protein product, partial [Ectocarpus sp. 6 AP-2014]
VTRRRPQRPPPELRRGRERPKRVGSGTCPHGHAGPRGSVIPATAQGAHSGTLMEAPMSPTLPRQPPHPFSPSLSSCSKHSPNNLNGSPSSRPHSNNPSHSYSSNRARRSPDAALGRPVWPILARWLEAA